MPHPWVQLEPFELSFNEFSSIFDPDKLLKFMPTFQLEAPQSGICGSLPPLPPCPLWFGVRKITWFAPHPWVQLEPFELSFNEFSSIFDHVTSCSSSCPHSSWKPLRGICGSLPPPCPLWFGVRKNTWFEDLTLGSNWNLLSSHAMNFHPFLTMTSCSSSCPHSSWKPLRGICGSLPPPCPLWFGVRPNTWFVATPLGPIGTF